MLITWEVGKRGVVNVPVADACPTTLGEVMNAMLGNGKKECLGMSAPNSTPEGCVTSFAAVPTADNVKWLVPFNQGRAALRGFQSYSPFRLRGRILKQLLISASRLGMLPCISTEVVIRSEGSLELEELAREVTGESNISLCVTVGTATRFQKLTIQVLNSDGSPLAFIKLPMTGAAAGRIRHEAAVLRQLGETSMRDSVPQVLFEGVWGLDSHLLMLSPVPGRVSSLQLGPAHMEFLRVLGALNPVTRPASAILDEVLCEAQHGQLSEDLNTLAFPALFQAKREVGDLPVPCGRIHGDFAPWNLRLGARGLCSFDWESSELRAPLIWDVFHFQTQVSSLLKKGMVSWTRQYLESALDRTLLLAYLVRSICQATNEETPNASMVATRRQILHTLARVPICA